MKRFRYGGDAICLVAVALYAFNRWLMKPAFPGGFLHDHFNDLFLIPAALPWVLWIDRRLGWRRDDGMPTASEVALHVVVWSLVCEGIGPHFIHHGTGDLGDVCAYVAGAAVAWAWWNPTRFRKPREEENTCRCPGDDGTSQCTDSENGEISRGRQYVINPRSPERASGPAAGGWPRSMMRRTDSPPSGSCSMSDGL